MNILAPVNTYESAIKLINAGADEVYVGLDDELFKTFSFTGRGKISHKGLKVLPSIAALKDIVGFAHDKSVTVNFIANIPFFNNGSSNGKTMESLYLNYVEKGIKAGVDSIVIGDIGLLNKVHQQNYGVDLHASIYFKTINSQELLFLKDFGVTRTTLSYHITLEEIERLCKKNIMDIEVVGYLGCSFFNGACGFLHELGEGILDNFDPGIACKNIYGFFNGDNIRNVSFDVETGCSVCSLHRLEQLGVKAVKIVGRDRNIKEIEEVVSLYKTSLIAQREHRFSDAVDIPVPTWWRRIWCSRNKCKYINNAYSHYIIGGD